MYKRVFVSLLAGTGFWFFSKLLQEYEYRTKVAVEFTDLPKEMTFLERTESVLVAVRGTGLNLIRFKLFRPKLVYSVGDRISGSLDVDSRHLRPDVRVEIRAIYPKEVRFTLDEVHEKIMPVSPTFRGKPKRGFVFLSWSTGDYVRVIGPKRLLEALDSIPTYPIDLTGRSRSFTVFVPVVLEGLNAIADPESVKVHVVIDSLVLRRITVVTQDTTYTLLVRGPSSILESIGPTVEEPRFPEGVEVIEM